LVRLLPPSDLAHRGRLEIEAERELGIVLVAKEKTAANS
jgi:hypothetical protein